MKVIISICIFFIVQLSLAQELDTITWRQSYRLTWADSKGTPQSGRPEGAITSVEFIYGVFGEENKIECVVMCYFDRKLSWGIDKYKNNYVLSHEQGHFDLYEIKARKLRKLLSKKTFTKETLENDIKILAEQILKESAEEQEKYDKETGFGISEDNQKKWTQKIDEELKKSQEYGVSHLVLKIK